MTGRQHAGMKPGPQIIFRALPLFGLGIWVSQYKSHYIYVHSQSQGANTRQTVVFNTTWFFSFLHTLICMLKKYKIFHYTVHRQKLVSKPIIWRQSLHRCVSVRWVVWLLAEYDSRKRKGKSDIQGTGLWVIWYMLVLRVMKYLWFHSWSVPIHLRQKYFLHWKLVYLKRTKANNCWARRLLGGALPLCLSTGWRPGSVPYCLCQRPVWAADGLQTVWSPRRGKLPQEVGRDDQTGLMAPRMKDSSGTLHSVMSVVRRRG